MIPSISVVIPAYNEEKRIGPTLSEISKFLSKRDWDYEIIVVNDGSTDRTYEIVEEASKSIDPKIRIVSNDKNNGKGASVRKGILASKKELILISDADLSTPIREVDKLLSELDHRATIAIGSRGLPTSDIKIHQPFYREWAGKTFNLFVRFFLGTTIRDTQCGFKLFRGEVARRIFQVQRLDGFAFDAEVLYLANMLGCAIKEVPVVWLNSKGSKVRLFRDSLKMFLDLLRILVYRLRGNYRSAT